MNGAEMKACISEGWGTYLTGLPLDSCPYEDNTDEAKWWKHGWMTSKNVKYKEESRRNLQKAQEIVKRVGKGVRGASIR